MEPEAYIFRYYKKFLLLRRKDKTDLLFWWYKNRLHRCLVTDIEILIPIHELSYEEINESHTILWKGTIGDVDDFLLKKILLKDQL